MTHPGWRSAPSVGSWSGNWALLWCLFGPVHVLGTYPIPQVPLRGQWGHSGPSLPTDPQTPCPPAVALTPACKRMHLRTTRAHGHFVWTSCSLSDVVLSAPPLGTKLCSQMESTPVAEKSGVPLPLSTCLTPVWKASSRSKPLVPWNWGEKKQRVLYISVAVNNSEIFHCISFDPDPKVMI